MKIKEIKLFTNNIESLKHFYSEMLELPIFSSSNVSIAFQAGASLLSFTESELPENPYYHFAFNISEHKKDKAMNWLKDRGIGLNLIEGKEDRYSLSWNSHSIYFYDPSGNIVEFIARHNVPSNSEGDFINTDILNISEIGLAVEDVVKTSEYLQSSYNEQIYVASNSMFAPIGDEEGLFIISALNRNWLGSNRKVETCPLEIFLLCGKNDETYLSHYPYKIICQIKNKQ